MLSEKIKKLRQSKHYSQKQVAIKLGITQGAVSQWELGLTEPGADQLIALAQIFDTTVYELKGIDDPTKKEPVKKNGLRETVADIRHRALMDEVRNIRRIHYSSASGGFSSGSTIN